MSRIAKDCGNVRNILLRTFRTGSSSLLTRQTRLIRVLYSVKLTTPVVSLFRRFVARRGWERLFRSLQEIWCTDYTDIMGRHGLWKCSEHFTQNFSNGVIIPSHPSDPRHPPSQLTAFFHHPPQAQKATVTLRTSGLAASWLVALCGARLAPRNPNGVS